MSYQSHERDEGRIETPLETMVAGNDEAMNRIRGSHLLLVEDNYLNQQIVQELLVSAGVRVTVAGNGREALQKIHIAGLDVVLMDIKMPILDGYQATCQIRLDPTFHALPIIALTANSEASEIVKCWEAGMNDYVSKPIDPDNLYKVLARWVRPGPGKRVFPPTAPRGAEGAPIIVLPTKLPGISLEDGLKCALGKADFYRETLLIFLKTTQESAGEIRAELASGDRGLAALLAHSMKSNAAIIGAGELSTAAGHLERAIESGDCERWKKSLSEYEHQLLFVRCGLENAFTGRQG